MDMFLQTKIAIIVTTRYVFLGCRYIKNAFVAGALPQTLLGAAHSAPPDTLATFKHCWLMTGY